MTTIAPQLEDDPLTSEQAQAMLDEARADFAAGNVVSHARMVEWAVLRARGDRVALPASEAELATRNTLRS